MEDLTTMERSVTRIALKQYRDRLRDEIKRRHNEPGFHAAENIAALVEVDGALGKLGPA